MKTHKIILPIIGLIVMIAASVSKAETATSADCNTSAKICDSNKGKPSGNGCIALTARARKNWTTAKSYPGGRPALCGSSSGKSYTDEQVKFQTTK